MGVTTTPPRPGNDFVDRKNEENGERLEQQEQLDNVQLQPTDSRIQEQQIQAQQDRFDGENSPVHEELENLDESSDNVAPINDPTRQQRQNNDRVLKGKIIVSRDRSEAMLIRPIDTREHQNRILNKELPRHTIFYRNGWKSMRFRPINTWEDQKRPIDEKFTIHVNAKIAEVVDTWHDKPKEKRRKNEKGKDPERFKCPAPGCDYHSSDKTNVETHVSKFTGERLYACAFCDKLFPGASNRNAHEEGKAHGIKKEWKCTFVDEKGKACGKITHGATHKGLVAHQKIHGRKKTKCTTCNRNLVYYPGQDPEEVKKAHRDECLKMLAPPPRANVLTDIVYYYEPVNDPSQADNQENGSNEVSRAGGVTRIDEHYEIPIPGAPPPLVRVLTEIVNYYKVVNDPSHADNQVNGSAEMGIPPRAPPLAEYEQTGYYEHYKMREVFDPSQDGNQNNGPYKEYHTIDKENGLMEWHQLYNPEPDNQRTELHENLGSPVDDQENGSTMGLDEFGEFDGSA